MPGGYQRDVTQSGVASAPVPTAATTIIPIQLDAAFMEEARENMKVMEEKTKVTHNLFGVLFKVSPDVAGQRI